MNYMTPNGENGLKMTKDEAIAFLETLEADDNIKDATSVLEALRNTREEAKTHREALEEANTQIEKLQNFKKTGKTNALLNELRGKGIKNPERIAKILDADKIDFDDDGNLAGFEEQYELANTEWPELFDVKRRAGDIDQYKNDVPEAKLSTTQQQLKMLNDAHR